MSEFGRLFNEARKRQGFRSQAHLDASYRAWDHTATCAECQKQGPGVILDDGYQPTMNRCPAGLQLDRKSFNF